MVGVIVHEWIERTGGAERVIDAFTRIIPGSDIVCLWNDAPGRYADSLVHESILARTILRKSKALALPAMPVSWRYRRGYDYEWALVSSHLFAHHVRFRGNDELEKFVYVHTPARYIWDPGLDSRGNSTLVRAVAPLFRSIDRKSAGRVENFAANSRFVADRISRFWNAEASVIYPPVAVESIQSVSDWSEKLGLEDCQIASSLPSEFILGASRLVAYKRLDAVIRAGELSGLPVVIAGSGPDIERIRSVAENAKVPVFLLGGVSDELLYFLYSVCVVYAFLGVEDFGIMPVEAMAAGARVVANRVGGVGESVVDGETGALCNPDDPESLRDAIHRAAKCNRSASRALALQFDESRFANHIKDWVGHDRIGRHADMISLGSGKG
ncbi:glycosyltransferase [Rhodococcus sp. A14]|uniref:glycosyltransferase n=1 Tax=Rhodococcus sp. A14 TaxID=1194106 RepID=UPI0014205ECF|nr:glycosyltransferase family 4 protein [Rhodococcus sp. A14]